MRRTLLVSVSVGLCVIIGACGRGSAKPTRTALPSSTPTPRAAVQHGWIYAGRDGVAYILWTDNAGSLTGEMQTLRPGDESPEAQSAPFDGILSGGQVSLQFTGGGTWTGTLRDDKLTLVAPSSSGDGRLVTLVFTPGAVDDYNRAVGVFRREQADKANALAAETARNNDVATRVAIAETATARADRTATAEAFRQAIVASGVKYQIITPFESSACAAPYTSYTEKSFSNHEYGTVFTICVNLNAVGALYQGRPAWYVLPAEGCPRDAFGYEPYADLHQQGPIVCIDGTLLDDADDLGEF